MKINHPLLTVLLNILFIICSPACTIFSGIDKKGQVWAGNNEDNLFNFHTVLHLIPGNDTLFGYMYFTNTARSDEFIQGGINEAGLFYDCNSVAPSTYKDYDKKKDYPRGNFALLTHILGKCKTVPEAMRLLETYRLPGLEGGQMHFADKEGNLGIIVADSMWLTKAPYQISTNYNVCHANKDGENCWRYPIAERILQSKGAGIDSFREIADSTSQKKIASTLYTNIHNLNTGQLWLYYGMDFNHPYTTTLHALLKKGNTSFPLRELFTENSLVQIYSGYTGAGIEAGLKKLDAQALPTVEKNQIIRLLYYGLVVYDHAFNAYTALHERLVEAEETDELLYLTNGFALFCLGKTNEGVAMLNDYVKDHPGGRFEKYAVGLAGQMQGHFHEKANTHFELKGYENARYVLLEGITHPNIEYFLVPQEGKWVGNFNIDPDEYTYYFSVDGKRVLDPNNSDIVTVDKKAYNKIIVKK